MYTLGCKNISKILEGRNSALFFNLMKFGYGFPMYLAILKLLQQIDPKGN